MSQNTPTDYAPLKPFARLIGDWDLTHCDLNTNKEWKGHDTFEWLPGGRFLLMRHHEDGNSGMTDGIDGVKIIGQEMGWDETEPSKEIIGNWFESSSGHHYKYIWEVEGDRVQFWLTSKDSGWCFKGKFSEDGNTIEGAWTWPDGGYHLIMQHV